MDEIEVDWAHELGLTVRELWMEHPGHPNQLHAKRLMMDQADLYWKKQTLERLWSDWGGEYWLTESASGTIE